MKISLHHAEKENFTDVLLSNLKHTHTKRVANNGASHTTRGNNAPPHVISPDLMVKQIEKNKAKTERQVSVHEKNGWGHAVNTGSHISVGISMQTNVSLKG